MIMFKETKDKSGYEYLITMNYNGYKLFFIAGKAFSTLEDAKKYSVNHVEMIKQCYNVTPDNIKELSEVTIQNWYWFLKAIKE